MNSVPNYIHHTPAPPYISVPLPHKPAHTHPSAPTSMHYNQSHSPAQPMYSHHQPQTPGYMCDDSVIRQPIYSSSGVPVGHLQQRQITPMSTNETVISASQSPTMQPPVWTSVSASSSTMAGAQPMSPASEESESNKARKEEEELAAAKILEERRKRNANASARFRRRRNERERELVDRCMFLEQTLSSLVSRDEFTRIIENAPSASALEQVRKPLPFRPTINAIVDNHKAGNESSGNQNLWSSCENLQSQMTDALSRIQFLEDQVANLKHSSV